MIQQITGLLSGWVLRRNQIGQRAPRSQRARLLAMGSIMLLVALGVSGCAVAPDVASSTIGQNLTERIIEVLLYPILIIQTAMGVSAVALTISVSGTTPGDAARTLRARWRGVFRRLRPGLVLVTLVRLVLIGLVLWGLAASEGRSIDLLIGSNTAMSVQTASLGLFVSFTAALLIPFTLVAFDGAAGVLLSVVFKRRLYSLIFQIVEFVLRAAFVVGITWLTLGYVAGSHPLGPWLAWLTVFGFSSLADWGLMMMHFSFVREVWGTIPYGVFIGAALLVFAIGQAILADLMLRLAAILAEKRG